MSRYADTEQLKRLERLLHALSTAWRDRDELIEAAGAYPEEIMSARAMFRRDMHALERLGFLVERTPEHHAPQWRCIGHAKFGPARRRFGG